MLTIKEMKIKDGTSASFPSPGVLCVVGGNNVGKSQLLRDVVESISQEFSVSIVLDQLEYQIDLTTENAEEWFRANSDPSIDEEPGFLPIFPDIGRPNKGLTTLESLLSEVANNSWHKLSDWLIENLDASERSNLATKSNTSPTNSKSPLFKLLRDGTKATQLSELCNKTFGFPLTLDRVNGAPCLRVGDPDIAEPPLQRPTLEWSDAVRALPELRAQGDGVRNYLGMVLHMMTSPVGVTVIDEPEAFLHPAQAKALGRHLGNVIADQRRQLLTATHDRDFVLGLLESDIDVTFLRLDRKGNTTFAKALEASDVRRIWDRPELRYSNVLQGLFHRVVVVCEGDADCRWYSAVLDSALREMQAPSEEVLFLPAGGKTGVQNCVVALDAIDVNCFVVLDFDALLDPGQLSVLLRSFGNHDHDEQILTLARNITQDISPEVRDRAKTAGIPGLPRGDKQRMAKEAAALLAKRDLLLVGVGELESFYGDLGGKGATWVTRALEQRLHEECAPAKELLRPVVDALLASRPTAVANKTRPGDTTDTM